MEPQPMPSGPHPLLSVAVVADNPETLDGLHGYLSGAGVSSHATRVLGRSASFPADLSAIVIFPDELDAADVVARVAELRRARPRLLVVLVTSAPQRFFVAVQPDGRSLLPIVLPKPAFGWSILDAVRAHARGGRP
jgi:hypothetical protein